VLSSDSQQLKNDYATWKYEGRLKGSCTRLITPSWNFSRCGYGLFLEVPPLANDALLTTLHSILENVLEFTASFSGIVKQTGFLRRSSFLLAGKAQKSHGARCGLHRLDGSIIVFLIHFFQAEYRIQSRNVDAPQRKYLLHHSKVVIFK
jgi:hypothetical protein